MALLHEPKILFMDEPTIGLDANTRRSLWTLIKRINKECGITILLTTHYIEEADILCDRLAIINHGKIIAAGSPQDLKSTIGGDMVVVEFFRAFDFSAIKNVAGVKTIRQEEERGSEKTLKLFIKVTDAETILPRLISKITEFEPNVIKSIRIEKPNLEAIFLELTGMRINEAEEKFDYKQFYTKVRSSR